MAEVLSCSAISRTHNEALAGTVKPTDTYFLIETNVPEYGGWGHEIVKTISKTGDFAPYIKHLMSVPRAKVLLIRRPQADEMNFYIAITNQAQPKIYHTMLSSYADLLTVDTASIAPDSVPQVNGQAMSEVNELYAVCTNGKHDACCSTLGIPVYNALLQHADENHVWQTTHIGGHRMAGTLIAFPHGICYGNLDAFNAEEVVTNHRAGYVLTYKYRGCSAYYGHALDVPTHQAVEAAEYHVRETAKKYAIADLALKQVESTGDMQWQVEFVDKTGKLYQTQVTTGESEPRQSSCNEEAKPIPVHTVTEYAIAESE